MARKAHFKKGREPTEDERQMEEELFTLPPQVEHQELTYQQNVPPTSADQAEAPSAAANAGAANAGAANAETETQQEQQ